MASFKVGRARPARSMRIKETLPSRIFDGVNCALMFLLMVVMVYPFLHVIALSITSDEVMVSSAMVRLIPEKVSLDSYRKVLGSSYIASGYTYTVLRTVLGTLLSVLVTTTTAYPLSKKHFPNRNFWTMIIVFTMIFSGGLIPTFLLVKSLGLINSLMALILPGLINTFNMIIMRNFFMTLPESLEESARIDGATDLRILISVIIPLSLSIVATVALWTAVGHWNAWFDSLIYTTDTKKLVLQVVLRRILLEGTMQMVDPTTSQTDAFAVNPDTLKAASIMVTTLPIIVVYPFVQKYFIKGVLIGSLKG